MKLRLAASLAALLALSALAPARAEGGDPIAEQLFPPDLVLRYASDIGLDDAQRAAIKDAVVKAQTTVLGAQLDLQEASAQMVRQLQATPVDETATLARLDRILALEKEMKHAQISLLVGIKNRLSAKQQEKLRDLRRGAS